MKNYLKHRKEMVRDIMFRCGENVDYRGRGKSLQLSLRYVLEALISPQRKVAVKDHYPTTQSNLILLDRCRDIVARLELDGFKFNKTECTIEFIGYD